MQLESKMKENRGDKYEYNLKKIQIIRERELRSLERRNQYQLAELKRDQEQAKRLRIIDIWNYKERFKAIKKSIPQKNPFFNKDAISKYIESAFDMTNRPNRNNVKLPSIT